ncbi:MAG: 4Fe-4S dicluster domain-containing protein, partial [Caldilineaceae bacterium]
MSTQQIELLATVSALDTDLYDTCVRCGLCLQSCPTYTLLDLEASSPRGRIALIRGVGEGRIPVDAPGFLKQMDQCLGCLACQAVCPSGVQYGHLLEAGRAQAKAARPQSVQARLIEKFVFGWLFMSLGRVRLLATLMATYQRTGLQWLARRLGVLKLMGMAQMEQLLPRMSHSFVRADGRSYAPV